MLSGQTPADVQSGKLPHGIARPRASEGARIAVLPRNASPHRSDPFSLRALKLKQVTQVTLS
jgi:hypothetical protein